MNARWISRLGFRAHPNLQLGCDQRWIETSGGRIRARVSGGSGNTVLIASDAPNVIENYDRWVARFRDAFQHHRCVVFELPGFGLSGPSSGFDFSLAAMAKAVRDVVLELAPNGATLAFPCANGFIALEVARRWPQLVRRLVLSQTPSPAAMKRWLGRVDKRRLLQTPIVGQAIMRLATKRVTKSWYRAALPKGADAAPFQVPALEVQARGGRFSLASFIQAFADLESHDFGQIATPTTLLWGERDRTHRGTAADSLRELVPNATSIVVPCGHFPDLEATDTWLKAYGEV